MKAVFVHDHNFVLNPKDGLYYDGSGGVFTSSLWQRYLSIFEELVVVGRKIDMLPNKLTLSSCEYVSFALVENAHSLRNRLLNVASIKEQLKYTILKADFVIIRLPSFLGSLAFSICQKYNKKYLIEVVGDPYDAYKYHGSILGKFVAPFEMIKLKNIVKKAENVIYVTQSKLQERYFNPNNSIGISNVQLYNVLDEDIIEGYYNEESDVFKLALIGTFHVKYKGHYELLNAVKYLKKNNSIKNIKVYFVGTGDATWVIDLAKELEVNENIEIVGALKAGEEGIIPFLDNIDCYVHPSMTEGLPRVVIEAMSRGRLCLTSDAGGVGELIDLQYIHKAGDWVTLGKHIKELYELKAQERYKIGMKNLEKSKLYLEDVLQERRVKFIQNIIKNVTD
ncbi:glycosyltransferase [Myroides sp. LoEW2-1]|uniref:glycosyltransferase n=1 Tax=Myroides sp. LoEW2-1 TaxID=2683192 RepID=UPI001323AB05|nr:glycosyltransferase [Myroides sp. LoEW2-1]MVX35315.1 glycosyltransferase [Myroides sp. LoEW2-1]